MSGFSRTRDQKPATPRVGVAHDLETGDCGFRPFDDHVLQEIAQARLHGAFVAVADFDIVGNGSPLIHLAIRLREDGAWRIAVRGARGFELLQRLQARCAAGELVLQGAHGARAPLVFDACAGQLRLAGGARNPRRFDLVLRVLQPGCRRGAVRLDPVGLHAHVIFLDIQLRQRFCDPFARGRRVLEGVAERSRRVDGRKDFAASRLDIRF